MTLDASMVSGDTKILRITAQNSSGTAINLNGATIIWSLFPLGGGAAIVTKGIGNGIVLTTPGSGIFEVTINPADTASLSGAFAHETQITDTDGNILTLTNVGLAPAILEIVTDLIT